MNGLENDQPCYDIEDQLTRRWLSKMDDEIYNNLPDNPELAFAQLEAHYREEMERNISGIEDGDSELYFRSNYINKIIAAAKALDIVGIKSYSMPNKREDVWWYYGEFETDVTNLIVQIKINNARRVRKYSVHLSGSEKEKIRHYIEKIKKLIENSDIFIDKKEDIYKKLASLALEVDRDRTRFEAIADCIRAMARLSAEVEREGARPWWKWAELLLRVIDDAKEKEETTSLPAPEERKKLEPPRKELPGRKPTSDLDDEVPF